MKKIALILAVMLTLSACTHNVPLKSADLMKEIRQNTVTPLALGEPTGRAGDRSAQLTEFSLRLLDQLNLEENAMISPLSIASALSMTANGADGETLAQMETTLGTDLESLNQFLYAYRTMLPTGEKYKTSLANSIWMHQKESLHVEKDFLQTNKDFYDAAMYSAPFDESTKEEINRWVNEKTDGQITKLLEEAPPPNAVMYLINALAFDGEWQSIYEEDQIRKGEFTKANGEKQTVEFMHSEEFSYLSLPGATGFLKPYADSKYSFAALLPSEGVSPAQLIKNLKGSVLLSALKNAGEETVIASMPKFEFSYGTLLNDPLQSLGMADAFDSDRADFKKMAVSDEGNIFISRVIHKTKIRVDEKGTKAGAVTAVEMADKAAAPEFSPKKVTLDRPFVFMIVDNTCHMPLFLGVMNSPAS